jgi:hypothetical protein
MKVFSSYFDSEWSFAQYKVTDRKVRLAFGGDANSVNIVGFDGNFYTVSFDSVNGGECMEQYKKKIFEEK